MANEFKIKKGLIVTGASGGTVVDIQGSQGQLFSVTDNLSGSIFAVSDISGVPILDVNSSGLSTFDGDVNLPDSKKILLGTGNDFQLYHDGTHGVLNNTTGNLYTSALGSLMFRTSLNVTALTLDTSQNATFAGDVTVEGSHLKILNHTGAYKGAATDYLYVGGSGLDGTDGAIYLGNSGDDTGYGWRFFYLGSGSGNGNKLIIRSENAGSGVDALSFTQDGNSTFATQAFSAATSSGDASSTLTTKGYVDGLITGATIYRGAWDPSGGGYGSPDLSGVTQTSGYYYICSADGTAEPNGTGTEPDTWAVGDWVIYNDVSGAGQWQKIDNSSVLSGVGTGQTVALWEGAGSVTDSETLGNAPITVSGNNTTFTGAGAVIATGLFRGDTLNNQANTHNMIYRSGTTTFIAGGDKLVVQDGGNVGIGTASPTSTLTISSDVGADGSWNKSGILIENTSTTTGEPTLAFRNAGTAGTGANYWFTGLNQNTPYKLAYGTSFTDGNTKLALSPTGALTLNSYTQGFLQTDANGNVGLTGGGTLPGGPYLPLSAGTGYPLTNTLFLGSTQNNSNEYNWLVFNNQASGYGDWNIYKLGNNNLAFGYGTTAGASYNNALTLEYNGNVGIGTTDPSQKFEVSTDNYNVSKFVGNTDDGDGYVGAVLEIETNNDSRGRGVYLTHRNATDTSDNEWYAGVPYTGDGYSIGNAVYATSINSAAGPAHKDQSKLFIENTGNVGIGTTSPDYLLDVEGSVNNDDIAIRINNTFDDNLATSNPTSVLWLNAASNNGYLRVHGAPANTAAKHQIDLGSTAGSSFLTFSPGGAEKMRITTLGGISFGSTGTAYGSSGQVLTSGGDASPTWTTPTTGTVTGSGAATQVAFWDGTSSLSGNSDLWWDNTNGHLGIGDTTPGSRLKVTSGTSETSIYTVDINHVRNDANVSTMAMRLNVDLSGADTTTADRTNYGLFVDTDSSANGDATHEHRIRGVGSFVNFTGFTDVAQGGHFLAESNYTGAKTSQLVGVYGQATHDTSSTDGGVSNMYGVFGTSSIQDLGDVDNAFGGYFSVSISTNRGNANVGVTKGVEGHIDIDKANTITYGEMMAVSGIIDNNEGTVPTFGNQYLFKGDYQGTKGGNAYGIYCEGDKHYFDGNVGIGITGPGNKLTVATAQGTTFSDAFLGLKATATTDTTGRTAISLATSTVNNYGVTLNGIRQGSTSGEPRFGIKMHNNSAGGLEALSIRSSGNVGIGTTSPSSLLSLGNAVDDQKLLLYDNSDFNKYGFGIQSNEFRQFYPSNSFLSIGTISTVDGSTYAERMRIDSNGNVGIGTTSPQQLLHVAKSNAPAGIEIQGGLNAITAVGDVHGFIDFGTNDGSATGGIAGRIESLSETTNGAHNGLAFYTGRQNRTPYLQKAMQIGSTGAISFGSNALDYGSAGEILVSNGNASPSWDAASTVIGGPYLPLAGGTLTGGLTINLSSEGTYFTGGSSAIRQLSITSGTNISANALHTFNIASSNGKYEFDVNGTTEFSLDSSSAVFTGNVGIGTTSPNAKLDIQGTQGQLFSVTDNLSGSIFAVADISGVPIFDVNSSGVSTFDGEVNISRGTNFYTLNVGATSSGSIYTDGRIFGGGDFYVTGESIFNGNVGINITNPQAKLDVFSGYLGNAINNTSTQAIFGGRNSNYSNLYVQDYRTAAGSDWTSSGKRIQMRIDSTYMGYMQFNGTGNNGGISFGTGTSTTQANVTEKIKILSSGATTFTSTVTAANFILSSDERLKENIEKACDNRIKADWKTFELKTDKGQKRYGVIAQELEKTNPEFVREDTQGFKSVAYIDLLIAKIAELEARLEKAGI